DQDNLTAFYRQGEDQTLLVIANYQKEPQTITLEADVKNVLLNNCGEFQQKEKKLQLEGYQAVVLEMH
ncbi:MAG: alpha-glucosidase C-terminal domain-containing protein, partial [Lachnospiraceae bacterium]|nr:alpha-glucosidase C-terminal domain-containing protein [Lachnospiraceae bacterium]